MSLSINSAMLVAARILVGMGGGVATVVVPMYLNEISPTNYRGAIGVLSQLAFTVGSQTEKKIERNIFERRNRLEEDSGFFVFSMQG